MAIKTDAEKITPLVVSTLSLAHESLTFILWRSFHCWIIEQEFLKTVVEPFQVNMQMAFYAPSKRSDAVEIAQIFIKGKIKIKQDQTQDKWVRTEKQKK